MGSYPISLKLITNSNKCLLINKKNKTNFPIKLFIGKKDNIVTLKDTLDIYNILKTKNKEILVQNEGDHSLSKLKRFKQNSKSNFKFFNIEFSPSLYVGYLSCTFKIFLFFIFDSFYYLYKNLTKKNSLFYLC